MDCIKVTGIEIKITNISTNYNTTHIFTGSGMGPVMVGGCLYTLGQHTDHLVMLAPKKRKVAPSARQLPWPPTRPPLYLHPASLHPPPIAPTGMMQMNKYNYLVPNKCNVDPNGD